MEITAFDCYKMELPDSYTEKNINTPMTYLANLWMGKQTDSVCSRFESSKTFIADDNATVSMMLNGKKLEKKDVKNRMIDYLLSYERVMPGFKRGEAKIRRGENFNTGIFTFQVDVNDHSTYNMFTVTNCNDQEMIMVLNCDMNDVFSKICEFRDIINSIEEISA